MIYKIFTLFLCCVFISCKVKFVKSNKNLDAAEARMELKNLWVWLDDYRSVNGHFPQDLSDLKVINPTLLSKYEYTPNAGAILVKTNSSQCGTFWLLSSDGEIREIYSMDSRGE